MLNAVENVTIFSTCKAFQGTTAIMQENAIRSWAALGCKIILFGDEVGVSEIAEETNALHVSEIKRNKNGIPLINDLFEKAKLYSDTPYLAYLNADIILTERFLNAVKHVSELFQLADPVFMTARRRNIPLEVPLVSETKDWFEQLKEVDQQYGTWDRSTAIDMFFFNRDGYANVLPFAVGRMQWDNWLIWKAVEEGASVIDASYEVDLLHPIHGYASHSKGLSVITQGQDARDNRELAQSNSMSMDEACSYILRDGTLYSYEGEAKARLDEFCMLDKKKHAQAVVSHLLTNFGERNLTDIIDCCCALFHKLNIYVSSNIGNFDSRKRNQIFDVLLTLKENLLSASNNINMFEDLQDLLCFELVDHVQKAQNAGRPIIIWGGSRLGKMVYELLKRKGVSIEKFVDKNPNIHGQKIDNLNIETVKLIGAESDSSIRPYFVIGSMYVVEISEELGLKGYDEKLDYYG